ncbi:MAG: hypothetical protein AAF495_03390 [Pseudomonadota bacterium]
MARLISILGILALVAAGLGAAAILTPSAEERAGSGCDSCSLRHQRLKKTDDEGS